VLGKRFTIFHPPTSTPHPITSNQVCGRRGSSTVVHVQVLQFFDRVCRRAGIGFRPGSFVLAILQHLVDRVLGAFLDVRTTVVSGCEQILQALPMLVQVHPSRPGDQPQTVGVVVSVRFQHLFQMVETVGVGIFVDVATVLRHRTHFRMLTAQCSAHDCAGDDLNGSRFVGYYIICVYVRRESAETRSSRCVVSRRAFPKLTR